MSISQRPMPDGNMENPSNPQGSPKELGDYVESALTTVGITKERVTKWLGAPCNCEGRKEKLNALSAWARRVVKGKVDQAKEFLEQIME